ncbi:hypothetical protein NW754_013151 [Fusarium falciforme]|uniref:Uncharacterized protein n=1 Tax=Fusarium falciforme TaxID=195108 RepID=A0A9W8QY86_9HYPO|nr:hypothetical protein NW754_013151 [Fusarium falciforme]KAJ4179628.1 hypothetical protein NW755_012353 [Fusarium falciforme]KAJ4199882.1 hypothetical protein NW767_007862 [Fusarium falciforme]
MISKIGSSLRALIFMGAAAILFSETMALEYVLQAVDPATLYNNRVTIWDSIPHLDVWIHQTEFDPPTVRVEITNENNHIITFSKWNSPLDPEAIQKKILQVNRQLDWPLTDLPIYGLRPNFTSPCEVHNKEKIEDLVELPPGFAIQQDHVFDKESGWDLSKRHRAGRLRKSAVQMVGMWHGVWNMTKEEVLELPAREDEYSECHWFTSNFVLPRF